MKNKNCTYNHRLSKLINKTVLVLLLFDHYQLELGYVLLPPNTVLVVFIVGSQKVVTVHDDVHEGVDSSDDYGGTSSQKFHGYPAGHHHVEVVIDVQEGDL